MLVSASLFAQTAPYLDPALPVEVRVNDLAGRMTLDEKIGQMMYRAPAIERLGIPAYNWWNEGLHGVARAGVATVFPQAIGLAATWDAPLLHDVADVISTEARAKYHEALRRGVHDQYQGLTFWSPNINIFRDPRWGRGQETYGEDPFLTSRMGVAFVRGLQGDDPRYLKALATPKHFAVHSGPEPLRHEFNVPVPARDLAATYLPAFRATVMEGGAGSVMCAYNAVDGKPACGSDMLLGNYLRRTWKFSGYVVSDCGAVDDIWKGHKSAGTPEQAASAAVKAGTDLDCGDEYKALSSAVTQGLITEEEIDRSVKRLLTARMRLGMFDPPARVPYAAIPFSENDSAAHRALNLRAARESMVLLKNNGVLPFKKGVKKIAVIGPNADALDVLVGNYNGTPSKPVTVLSGMRERFGVANVLYAPGTPLVNGFALAVPPEALHPGHLSSVQGLNAEYFGNKELSGAPVATRIDKNIDFDFGEAAPVPGLGKNNFSIRWTGFLTPAASGNYQLGASADDGFRVFLDGKKIVDDWSWHGMQTKLATVTLEAGREYAITMEYFQADWGASAQLLWLPPNLKAEAVAAAQRADAVVMVLGISPRLEGEEMKVEIEGFEGGDRTSLDLPAPQQALMEAIAATGKPLVVVLMNGSALAVNWAQAHADAILEAWYPGGEGGPAVAETLAGDNNPSGRLPVTFYKSVEDLPPFTDYSMKDRTYRYFKGEPLYRFGDGLSYSTFEYRNARVQPGVGTWSMSVEVTNSSGRDGAEVVQVYVSPGEAAEDPGLIRKLVAFQRVELKAHEKRRVELSFAFHDLAGVDDQGNPTRYSAPRFSVGGHQTGAGAISANVVLPRR
jgi:beta-glucosidase